MHNALRCTVIALVLSVIAAPSVSAQASGPPPAPVPRTQSEMYVPLYGITAGITIPVGRLSDDHGAGYAIGGLVEYAVTGQPYSLRGEGLFQRFPLKSGRTTGRDVNQFSIGTSIVYRLQQATAQPYVVGGIGIYNATLEGTRPGFNFGTGVEIPLTGFSAVAEIRMHAMLADTKPLLSIPLTVGVRF